MAVITHEWPFRFAVGTGSYYSAFGRRTDFQAWQFSGGGINSHGLALPESLLELEGCEPACGFACNGGLRERVMHIGKHLRLSCPRFY